MAISTVNPFQQAAVGRAFTPQTSRSRISEALLAQGTGGPSFTPFQALANATPQIIGALLARKAEEAGEERQQAAIQSIGDIAIASSAPNLRTQFGPTEQLPGAAGLGGVTSQDISAPGRIEQLQAAIRGAPSPEIALFGAQQLQRATSPQGQGFTNVQFDELGNAIGIRGGQVQAIPQAGRPGQPVSAFGQSERDRKAETRRRKIEGENFDKIDKLVTRARTDKRINDFLEVSTKFDRLISSEDSGAGDVTMIFSFMKILDPTSVVRESEFATAENTAGVPERVRNLYNRAITGERLTPAQRQNFTRQGQVIFDKSKETADKAIKPIEARAKRFNLRSETIREAIFGLPQPLPEGLPVGTADNGDGTFTLPDGQIVRPSGG